MGSFCRSTYDAGTPTRASRFRERRRPHARHLRRRPSHRRALVGRHERPRHGRQVLLLLLDQGQPWHLLGVRRHRTLPQGARLLQGRYAAWMVQPSRIANASKYIDGALYITARSTTPNYKGFKVAFTAKNTTRPHSGGVHHAGPSFKAGFAVPAGDD